MPINSVGTANSHRINGPPQSAGNFISRRHHKNRTLNLTSGQLSFNNPTALRQSANGRVHTSLQGAKLYEHEWRDTFSPQSRERKEIPFSQNTLLGQVQSYINHKKRKINKPRYLLSNFE